MVTVYPSKTFLCYSVCLLISIVFFSGSSFAQQQPSPHLVFTKSVVVKKYGNGHAYTEPHLVKKGEYLWQILRRQYKLSDSRILFYCNIARAVNPGIKDINSIVPDQEILIPYN